MSPGLSGENFTKSQKAFLPPVIPRPNFVISQVEIEIERSNPHRVTADRLAALLAGYVLNISAAGLVGADCTQCVRRTLLSQPNSHVIT